MSGPLGEALLKQGLLTREQFQAAVKRQSEYGGRLASILIEMGFVGDEAIAGVLSRQYRVQYVNLANYEIDDGVIDLVPIATAIRHQVLPLRKEGTTLFVAVADPTDINAVGHLEFMTGLRVTPLVAPQNAIRAAIEKHYGTEQAIELKRVYDQLQAEGEYELSLAPEETEMDLAELQKGSTEAPLIKLVNLILAEAIRKRASDIHIEPFEKNIRVRYRIDGVLFKVMDPPFQFKDAIVSRIKIMSSLDIAERRVPQDGRIKIRIKHEGRTKEIDFRVSTLPTMFGERWSCVSSTERNSPLTSLSWVSSPIR
jgi:type IV pilus assembly protein PilB